MVFHGWGVLVAANLPATLIPFLRIDSVSLPDAMGMQTNPEASWRQHAIQARGST